MPYISVIVPVYNLGILFTRCIDSIFAQTFTNYELIVIDDGSTDISGRISDYYAELDRRVIVIHKCNQGVASARNTGLELPNGQYICFVDSDDYLLPDYFVSLYSVIEKSDYDLVSQNIIISRDSGDIDSTVLRRESYEVCFRSEEDTYCFLVDRVLKGTTGWEMWGRIFRNDIIQINQIRVCEKCDNYAEDLSFFISYIVFCKRCCHIDYAGYCYYQRNNSMMNISQDIFKLNSVNEVSKYIYDFFSSKHKVYYLSDYALFHFWIMKTEFSKIYEIDIKLIPNEAKRIRQYHWYKKNINKCFYYFNRIALVYTKDIAFEYCNLCYYSIHKQYKLYHFIDVLYFKFQKHKMFND